MNSTPIPRDKRNKDFRNRPNPSLNSETSKYEACKFSDETVTMTNHSMEIDH